MEVGPGRRGARVSSRGSAAGSGRCLRAALRARGPGDSGPLPGGGLFAFPCPRGESSGAHLPRVFAFPQARGRGS